MGHVGRKKLASAQNYNRKLRIRGENLGVWLWIAMILGTGVWKWYVQFTSKFGTVCLRRRVLRDKIVQYGIQSPTATATAT